MKYKIKTDQFKNIELYEVKDYDDLTPLQQFCVDNGYPCFEPILEVEAGQYWEWCSHIYRVGEAHSERESWVKDILTDKEMSLPRNELTTNGRKLSDEQVGEALIEEAKRRGFGNGKRIVTIDGEKVTLECGFISGYDSINDCLRFAGKTIYKQGVWAEPVQEWEVVDPGLNRYVEKGQAQIKKMENGEFKVLTKDQAEAIAKALNDMIWRR